MSWLDSDSRFFDGRMVRESPVEFNVLSDGQHPVVPPQVLQDAVNHPPHYTSHPSGVECIQITEHMSFCVGNAIKYLWRADEKGKAVEDLKKARWYIDREIKLRESSGG